MFTFIDRFVMQQQVATTKEKTAPASGVRPTLPPAMNSPPVPAMAPSKVVEDVKGLQKAAKDMHKKLREQEEKMNLIMKSSGDNSTKMDEILSALRGGAGPSGLGHNSKAATQVQEGTGDDEVEEYDEDENIFENNDFYDEMLDREGDEDMEAESDSITKFSKGSGEVAKRVAPSPLGLQVWAQARKTSTDYGPDEWKVVSLQPYIKKYMLHHEALPFKAHEPDHNVEPLEWKREKDLEKQLLTIQNAVGAAANMVTSQLDGFDDMVASITATVKEYQVWNSVMINDSSDH